MPKSLRLLETKPKIESHVFKGGNGLKKAQENFCS